MKKTKPEFQHAQILGKRLDPFVPYLVAQYSTTIMINQLSNSVGSLLAIIGQFFLFHYELKTHWVGGLG